MILNKLADFTVALMEFNDQKVINGRKNVKNVNYKDDLIVIDILGTNETGSAHVFDDVNEVMEYATKFKGSFTFDFYGDNAYTNAYKFANLLKSQDAFDLSRTGDFTIFNASSITNLKNLQGAHHYERYQLEVFVSYFEVHNVDTLRIDTAQTEFLTSN